MKEYIALLEAINNEQIVTIIIDDEYQYNLDFVSNIIDNLKNKYKIKYDICISDLLRIEEKTIAVIKIDNDDINIWDYHELTKNDNIKLLIIRNINNTSNTMIFGERENSIKSDVVLLCGHNMIALKTPSYLKDVYPKLKINLSQVIRQIKLEKVKM